MAEGDNRAVYGGTAQTSREQLIGGGVVKAQPIAMPRLPEDTARSNYYAGTGTNHAELSQVQKDELPEHVERRTTYPLISSHN